MALLIIQPILMGVYARKYQCRSGTVWGIFALTINIGIVALFEIHMPGVSDDNGVAEIGTSIMFSTITVIVLLALLRKDSPETPQRTFSINLRRGLFRFWVLGSVLWTMLCALEFFQHCARYIGCEFFTLYYLGSGYTFPTYFDIGKWLIGFPVLAFAIGLATCWAIDGFGRPREDEPVGDANI